MAAKFLLTMAASALSVVLASCSSTNLADAKVYRSGKGRQGDGAKYYRVRTTAYSHVEADSLKYGRLNAAGGKLQYGSRVRSAAADWSVYPVGTIFQIEGEPYIYVIDDYGSALVGTKTIDLYRPNMAGIREWGARNVNIRVLKWGDYNRSLAILSDRLKYAHCRQMAERIRARG